MDKELLRLFLLGLGVCLVLGIYLWDRIKNDHKRPTQKSSDSEADDVEIADLFSVNPVEDAGREIDTVSIVPEGIDKGTKAVDEVDISKPTPSQESIPQTRSEALPAIVQLCVVAQAGELFDGESLVRVFDELDLHLGEMDIFHWYENGTENSVFGIANMVKPGTFPTKELNSFECPGLVLFLQPSQLAEPISVFDRLVYTAQEIAIRLNGELFDARQQPLSQEGINKLRDSLM